MNIADQIDFVADGHSATRRAELAAADAAVLAWRRAHPNTLDDYLDFLQTVHDMFGPFPRQRSAWATYDFRL